jgi:hypothetical protein
MMTATELFEFAITAPHVHRRHANGNIAWVVKHDEGWGSYCVEPNGHVFTRSAIDPTERIDLGRLTPEQLLYFGSQ